MVRAQPVTPPPEAPVNEEIPVEEVAAEEPADVPGVDVHGFVSQGAFISTDNDYLGHSERGTAEFTEAAVNLSREVADRLRVTLQLFTRDLGPIGDYRIVLDLAFIDYRWRQWLGVRAGRVKMPFGIFNEFNDAPSGRTAILLPQSIYPVTSRDFLLGLTGASIYGSPLLGGAGALDYQIYGGTIFIDDNANPQILEVDVHRVAGAQLFWRPPLEGLRIGGGWLNIRMDLDYQLDQATIDGLVDAGEVPADFDGRARFAVADANLLIASVDYAWRDWGFAAEYSRWLTHSGTRPEGLVADPDSDSERFYALATYRLDESYALGAYYSLKFADVEDRQGEGAAYPEPHLAYQRDLALTLRHDVNEFWLFKAEGHFIQGTADLRAADNPVAERAKNWGLFLVQTVLSF